MLKLGREVINAFTPLHFAFIRLPRCDLNGIISPRMLKLGREVINAFTPLHFAFIRLPRCILNGITVTTKYGQYFNLRRAKQLSPTMYALRQEHTKSSNETQYQDWHGHDANILARFPEGSHVANRRVRTANNLTQQVVQKHVDNAPWFAHHEHRRMELGDEGFQTYD